MDITEQSAIDHADDLSRDHAGYILASLGLNLDEQNFVENARTGARCWAGLGPWHVRVANVIRVHDEITRGQGRGAA